MYSKQLDFQLGATRSEQRSVLKVHEHASEGRNNAENSNAKSIAFKSLVCLMLLFLLVTPVFAYSAFSVSSNITNVVRKFDNYVENYLRSNREPGCAIAIVYQNRLIFMKTYGVRRIGTKDSINFDTVFQLGSVSKTFSSTLTAILQQHGMVNINTPVKYYLANFHLSNPASTNALQVKNILNHTSGVPRGGFNTKIEARTPFATLVDMVERTPVKASPGQYFDYHNVVYSLIGDIITRATHLSYRDALANYLLNPLHMTRTSSTLSELLQDSNRAYPHVRTRKGRFVPASNYSRGYYEVAPAAGINSSIRDMAIFLQLQMGAYPNVVNREILAGFQRPYVATPEMMYWVRNQRKYVSRVYYGLGWRILNLGGERIVFHGGWLKGFINYVGFLPERNVGIVVLHNAETRFASDAAMKFFALYLNRKNT